MRAKLICYWVATTLIGLETLAGGATDLMHGRTSLASGPFVLDVITHLGYPSYLLVILGIWKLLGGIVLFAPGLRDLGMISTVCREVTKPVNVLMGLKGATYSVPELEAAGVKRISVGRALARAALGAFVRAAREIKDRGTFTFAADAISHADVSKFMEPPRR